MWMRQCICVSLAETSRCFGIPQEGTVTNSNWKTSLLSKNVSGMKLKRVFVANCPCRQVFIMFVWTTEKS